MHFEINMVTYNGHFFIVSIPKTNKKKLERPYNLEKTTNFRQDWCCGYFYVDMNMEHSVLVRQSVLRMRDSSHCIKWISRQRADYKLSNQFWDQLYVDDMFSLTNIQRCQQS